MSTKTTEAKSAGVPAETSATQGEDIYGRWPWVERSVWTPRMLRALENGVRGSKWYSLIDKVWRSENLSAAWLGVTLNRGAAGVDGQTVAQFNRQATEELGRLSEEVRQGRYRPQPVRRFWIDKPGRVEKRPLGIPAVRDRIVQGAIRNVMEPIFERSFAAHSYGFRPGRGCKDALRRVQELLRSGHHWVVDLDLKSYFDTIPHDRLLERVQEQVADGRLIQLLESYLKAGVMEGLRGWEPTEQGTPQGAVISPLLANLYLSPLDHQMARQGYAMTRYADDLVIQCRSEAEARQALAVVQEWAQANGLVVHPTKTRIVDATQRGGFDFLGYHFERGLRWPRKRSLDKLKSTVRARTRRTSGQSLTVIIAGLNPVLRGWFGYFKHSHWAELRDLDKWIRMRLRSLLRKRHKRRGHGYGYDHVRWPNAYFERHGLYSLWRARALIIQSR